MQIIIPSNAHVIDIARQASAQHLHLLTDGRRTVLSPIITPGWYKIGVRIKKGRQAA